MSNVFTRLEVFHTHQKTTGKAKQMNSLRLEQTIEHLKELLAILVDAGMQVEEWGHKVPYQGILTQKIQCGLVEYCGILVRAIEAAKNKKDEETTG